MKTLYTHNTLAQQTAAQALRFESYVKHVDIVHAVLSLGLLIGLVMLANDAFAINVRCPSTSNINSGLNYGTNTNGVFTFSSTATTLVQGQLTDAQAFCKLTNIISDWVGGTLGKAVALVAFVLGLIMGAVKQNYIAAAGGIVVALLVAVMPTIVNNVSGVLL